jgi:hypothetical protein
MGTKERHYRYNEGAVSNQTALSPGACALWAAVVIALASVSRYLFG